MDQNGSFLQDESVDEYFKRVMGIIKTCQKYSNDLQGWENYSDYSGVHSSMLKVNRVIHNLINKVFSHQDIKLDVNGFNLSDQFEIVREGNDALFEKINSELDDAMGVRRNIDTDIFDSTVRTIRGPVENAPEREVVLIASRNVQKPQLFFNPKVNNSNKEPFIPMITEKPNSMKPLAIMICVSPDGREYYSNPYEYELLHFNVPEEFLEKVQPIAPLSMSQTPFLYVDNESTLQIMVDELKKTKEIAVDLENHGFRTYQGLTCLIQISTREKDYIIDPFPVRNHLPLLNEVFTDPKIIKVFHGADFDVLWLQRDCGVYVVNMFDTHQAAIVLEYPHRSLANLLYTFCSITANKSYQRSDWRIRPLPEDFLEYARQDSHYLLYIYDLMKNELIEKGNVMNNLLHATYNRSTELCLKRYEKPIVSPDSHLDLYRRSRKSFNPRQLYALQKLFLWRDNTARKHDESVDYVLPKHMMFQIAEILPKEVQGILACCNPIPTLVKTESLTLHQMIRSAREITFDEINIDENQLQPSSLTRIMDSNDIQSSITSKHDLSFIDEDPKGLSTIVNPQETLLGELFSQNRVTIKLRDNSLLFGISEESLCCQKYNLNKKTEDFMSPYQRYKIFLKFMTENEITPIEDDLSQKTEPTIQTRIDKVREHFMALNTKTGNGQLVSKNQSKNKINKETEENGKSIAKNNDNDQRLERVREHFMALNTKTGNRKSRSEVKSENEENEQGIARNEQGIAKNKRGIARNDQGIAKNEQGIAKNEHGTAKNTDNEERFERLKAHTDSLCSLSAFIGKGGNNNKKNKKRRNKKKIPLKNKGKNNWSVETTNQNSWNNSKKRQSTESYEDPSKKVKTGENGEVAGGSSEAPVTPYDYKNANCSDFKPKKRKFSKQRHIMQRFKGKRSKGPTGEKKSGEKSMSWGLPGTNN